MTELLIALVCLILAASFRALGKAVRELQEHSDLFTITIIGDGKRIALDGDHTERMQREMGSAEVQPHAALAGGSRQFPHNEELSASVADTLSGPRAPCHQHRFHQKCPLRRARTPRHRFPGGGAQ